MRYFLNNCWNMLWCPNPEVLICLCSFVDNVSLILFLRNGMLCTLIAKLPTSNRLLLPPTPMEASSALKNTIKMVMAVHSFFICVVFHRSVNVFKTAWFQSYCISLFVHSRIKCLSSYINHTSNTPCWAFGGEEEVDITGEKSYFEACIEVCPLMRLCKIYTVRFWTIFNMTIPVP